MRRAISTLSLAARLESRSVHRLEQHQPEAGQMGLDGELISVGLGRIAVDDGLKLPGHLPGPGVGAGDVVIGQVVAFAQGAEVFFLHGAVV